MSTKSTRAPHFQDSRESQPPATLDALTAAYVAAITPSGGPLHWAEGGSLEAGDRMIDIFHRMVDEAAQVPVASPDLTARLRAAMPADLWAEWQAYQDRMAARDSAREDLLFQFGMRVGRVLGGGTR